MAFTHAHAVHSSYGRGTLQIIIDRVLCIPPHEGKGAPCGACRELMVQLMPGKYKDIDIMIDYSKGRVIKLGDLTPEWWID